MFLFFYKKNINSETVVPVFTADPAKKLRRGLEWLYFTKFFNKKAGKLEYKSIFRSKCQFYNSGDPKKSSVWARLRGSMNPIIQLCSLHPFFLLKFIFFLYSSNRGFEEVKSGGSQSSYNSRASEAPKLSLDNKFAALRD